jgi:phosphopantetheinyl transferase (holo-ACP synthase)
MTGNDIVDLATAAVESNWKRKGFIEKIFTLQEQEYISNSATPEQMVWRLWTMKESAYKIYIRQFGGRFFAPQKLSCTIFSDTEGNIEINNSSYRSISIINKNYIYCTAKTAAADFNATTNCCFEITEADTDIQQFIYQKIIANFISSNKPRKHKLSIVKNEFGVPFLYYSFNKTKIPVSITHHGRYAAFTIN